MTEEQVGEKFINVVDKDLQENLIRLQQKLKGLLAEIDVKKELNLNAEGESAVEGLDMLATLSSQIQDVLGKLSLIANSSIQIESSKEEFQQMHNEELASLNEIIETNIKQITGLKEHF